MADSKVDVSHDGARGSAYHGEPVSGRKPSLMIRWRRVDQPQLQVPVNEAPWVDELYVLDRFNGTNRHSMDLCFAGKRCVGLMTVVQPSCYGEANKPSDPCSE
ncbi:MAG: hypothetical protein AB7F99_05905 [Vicinamibacterales bacterium]